MASVILCALFVSCSEYWGWIVVYKLFNKRLRWSRGKRAGLWCTSSRVQTRQNPSDFSGEKNPQHVFLRRRSKAVGPHVVNLRHVKEPKSEVKVVTFGKTLGNFSPIVPPSAAGVRERRYRRGDTWWRELKRSSHWSSRLGGMTCRWQRQSVKTFLLRILNDSWAGQNPQGLQCRLKKKKKDFNKLYR